MKKITATILIVLYFTASFGTVVQMHYCMGKFVSAGLWKFSDKDDCVSCGMVKKKGCCENKHQLIKIDKQYDVKVSADQIPSWSFALPLFFRPGLNSGILSAFYKTVPLSNSPPLSANTPLYISNCTYLI